MRVYRQDVMAVYAMIVDAKEGVRNFYTNKFKFVPLPDHPNRLFLHLETFVKGLAASSSP